MFNIFNRKCATCKYIEDHPLPKDNEIKWNDKLYLITRKDLSIAQQAVQSQHALAELLLENYNGYRQEYAEAKIRILKNWNKISSHLCFLAVENEEELKYLYDDLTACYFKDYNQGPILASFSEPDMGYKLTAIAVFPNGDEITKKLLRPLTLAMKDL